MKHLSRICVALAISYTTLAVAANSPTAILPDNIVLCQPNSGCFNKTLFGRSYKVLNTPRFLVMVSVSREAGYTRADVSISNNSGLPLNLTPDDFRIEVLSPKPKILSYISPTDLKNIPLSPAIPSLPTENTSAATTSSPRMLVASAPQTSSIDELYTGAKRREVLQEAYDKAVAQQHLAAASIAPDQTARGRVYFQSDKHTQAIDIVLPIAGLVFEFPYEMSR